jgi:hypothetical protein
VPKLQLWKESCGEARVILHENLDYHNRLSSKHFLTINFIRITTRGKHKFPDYLSLRATRTRHS